MSGLERVETFYDRTSDTKVLIAWSSHALICAFRGTDSWVNARSDLQVRICFSICQPMPGRGACFGRLLLLHKGMPAGQIWHLLHHGWVQPVSCLVRGSGPTSIAQPCQYPAAAVLTTDV